MAITQITPEEQVDAYLRLELERRNRVLLRTMYYVGERVLNAARSTQSYKDQTGNLRSSLGYVVVQDGEIVQASDFQPVKNGKEGVAKGQEYVRDLIRRNAEGIVLIVVAGMNYAQYVAAKGYDVLDSSELLAQELVPKMLKQLGF